MSEPLQPAPPAPSRTRQLLPPETLEGWYALHQLFVFDRHSFAAEPLAERRTALDDARRVLTEMVQPDAAGASGGWSQVVALVGSSADVMLVHLRPTLDDLAAVQQRIRSLAIARFLRSEYAFLSVTEAGLYHLTAQLSDDADRRGGAAGDSEYSAALAEKVSAEHASAHVQRRLYPTPPPGMPYVCFYPMSKRRQSGQNWYTLSLAERSQLMQAHGTTGRRYAGRVLQIITGAIGLAAWEWGVTLFAADPLDFKKLVTDMRFDEVSARYAEFGEFYVGKLAEPEGWLASLD